MKLTRQDIGGELISILTKGMYGDPKDALREYIQNGIDADGKNITVKIRHNTIAIVDDGKGMDKGIMRRAIRVGISDKNPGKSVGFMGIGLYSSFHLCDELVIYSKVKNESPNKLVFKFEQMRLFLEGQKDFRLASTKLQQQIDLQTLLEENIDFVSLAEESFPKVGTRVEMHGIESNFFRSLSKFEEVSEYLESVVPLPFSKEFSQGEEIQKYIDDVCKKHKTAFKIINLFLDINSSNKQLFRPYRDVDFSTGKSPGKPMKPVFYEMKSNEGFLGIAWGCLNSERDTITNVKVRGFIIKKQGFTIGKRSDLIPHFGRQTFFNRSVGEFIALHPKLLPNAPRSDFEYSGLRTAFIGEVKIVAKKFYEYADEYQENERAADDLANAVTEYNRITSQLEFFESNSDRLLEFFGYLNSAVTLLSKKLSTNRFRKNKEKEAGDFLKKLTSLKTEVKSLIDKKRKKPTVKRSASVTKKLIDAKPGTTHEPMPDSLQEIIFSLGFELSNDLLEIIQLLDEKYIKAGSDDKDDYKAKLLDLRNEIEDLFEKE